LAEKTVKFTNSYVASMPCMPARREMHTGRYNFLHRSWGPLEPFDDSMPELLKNNGVYTHLSTDHQHYFEDGGATYHQRYNSWQFARGQEGDAWKGIVKQPEIPANLLNVPAEIPMWRQDWVNRSFMPDEESQPQAKTFKKGLEFIESNYMEDNWFLHLETFDPHEPFFAQQHYKDLYPHEYDDLHFDWPPYRQVKESKQQVDHVRFEYAALLSMCDNYLGKVLDQMDRLDLWQDTMLIVNTDHGFLLGEHDWWAKMVQPFYNEVAHTPLFIWDPRSARKNIQRDQLVQTIDLPVTLLNYFGVDVSHDMQGIDLAGVIADNSSTREAVINGIHGGHVNCTDGRYVYMRAPEQAANTPLYEYTLMPTHMRSRFHHLELQQIELADPFSFTKGCPTMKIAGRSGSHYHEFGTLLFDLQSDPGQQQTVSDKHVEDRMIDLLRSCMVENDSPPEQFQRLGLN
jgi:arylsulfatase A-like enzyme